MTSCSQQRQGCTPHSDVCFGFVSCNLSFTSHHYPHRTSILLLCKRQIRVLAGKEFTINIHQTNDPPLSLKEKKTFTPPHPIMIQLDKQAWLDSLVTVREWYWQTLQGGTVRGTAHAFVFLHTPIFPNNRCNWNGGGGGNLSLLTGPFAVSFFSWFVLSDHLCCWNRPEAGQLSLILLALPPIILFHLSHKHARTHAQVLCPLFFARSFYYLFSLFSLSYKKHSLH